MAVWELDALRACRELRRLAGRALSEPNNASLITLVKEQMISISKGLAAMLPPDFPSSRIGDLRRHIAFSGQQDFQDILGLDLADIEEKIDAYSRAQVRTSAQSLAFADLLHPDIEAASQRHYAAGDYRNAVLDAVVCVFDKIRERTGLDEDGDRLVTTVFSLSKPRLILSEISTDSGRNDQTGFLDIFKGVYRGVRNPKAHSLSHDLNAQKAAQHLVLASILMRRVIEARLPE